MSKTTCRFIFIGIAIFCTIWFIKYHFNESGESLSEVEVHIQNYITTKKTNSRSVASLSTNSHSLTKLNPQVKERSFKRVNEAASETIDNNYESEILETPPDNNSQDSKTNEIAEAASNRIFSSNIPSHSTEIPNNQNNTGSTSQGDSITFGNSNPYNPGILQGVDNSSNERNNKEDIGSKLNCSASVSSGAYSYALSVSLSCSTTAQIKYCLSEGTCCDPDSSDGKIYSSSNPIIVGVKNSQYCLSYYAESSYTVSDIFKRTYDINKQLPDLYVETPVTWMQTTEAPIYSNVTSQNFGQSNFTLGQISYLTHDISPSGDDLNCEEIPLMMANYSSPSPLFSLSPFNISGLTTSNQIEIPLNATNLSYGLNYVATYLMNSNHAVPSYSCNISEITLLDFPYFESSGISASGEMVGGFTAFGFYENDLVSRSPAGESSFEDGNQKIESNLFSIFY